MQFENLPMQQGRWVSICTCSLRTCSIARVIFRFPIVRALIEVAPLIFKDYFKGYGEILMSMNHIDGAKVALKKRLLRDLQCKEASPTVHAA
jgi:hypothetical protein